MTEFVRRTSEVGTLFLPGEAARGAREVVRLRDSELLAAFTRDPGGAGAGECVAVLAAARRRRAEADAAEAEALARLDRLRDGDRYTADEVALELRVSRRQAQQRLARAQGLRRLPGVLGLLREGEFEGYTAGRIAEATAPVPDAVAAEIDARLCAKVRDGKIDLADPARLVRAARRLVDTLDPEGALARVRQARQQRGLELLPGAEGMSTLAAWLPAEVAASAYTRVDALARQQRNSGDARTLEQLRADVTAALLLGQDPGATVPAAAAMVSLHLPATTALTMTEHGCELDGYGPIPAAVAREMMTNPASVLRKVITDEQGAVTGVGAHSRRPNAALAALVRARDRACVHPGCHRPAARSDLDHQREHHRGGPTDPANLAPRCEHHHYLRDQPGWSVQITPDSRWSLVTTPTGRTYGKPADTILEPPTPTPTPGRDRPRSPLWTPEQPKPRMRLPRPPDRRPQHHRHHRHHRHRRGGSALEAVLRRHRHAVPLGAP